MTKKKNAANKAPDATPPADVSEPTSNPLENSKEKEWDDQIEEAHPNLPGNSGEE